MDASDFSYDQTLFEWRSPLRPYKKRSGVLLRFVLVLALLLSTVVFFFGDIVTLLPIWAVLGLFYIFAITPPPDTDHRITKFGIESAGVMVRWESLSYYYFSKRFGFDMLTIVAQGQYAFHSYMVIPNEHVKSEVNKILSTHIMYVPKPPRTFSDRAIDFLSKLLPEEEEVRNNPMNSTSVSSMIKTP